METELCRLESLANTALHNMHPEATYHDYANIVRKVEKATRLLDVAMRQIFKAQDELRQIANQQ